MQDNSVIFCVAIIAIASVLIFSAKYGSNAKPYWHQRVMQSGELIESRSASGPDPDEVLNMIMQGPIRRNGESESPAKLE